jgi:hypothetical protein
MLLLTYFDRRLGPTIFLTSPNNLAEIMDDTHLEQVKSLLNQADQSGFFTHNFSPELKTANYGFSLESPIARGRKELVLITAIVSEEEPDYSIYEKFLNKFVEKLHNIPKIFLAFYINSDSDLSEEKEKIQEKYMVLREELNNIYKILTIKPIEIHGQLFSLSMLTKNKEIKLSKELMTKLEAISKDRKNYFMVSRIRGDAIKVDLIPVNTNKLFSLSIIFGEQMTITILQQISTILSEQDISLVFTSGICQEVNRCIYEVFLDSDETILKQIIDKISIISGIIEIEAKVIEI